MRSSFFYGKNRLLNINFSLSFRQNAVAAWENFRFRALCGRIFRTKKRGLHEEETFIEEILIAKACGGVLLLSNLSLVSIGFSAWSIGTVTTGEAEINVSAADLIDINNYFVFEGTPSVFEYTSEGIANDHVIDSSLKNQEGYISIPFQIDVKSRKIADHMGEGASSLKLRTILVDKNDSLDFFGSCSITESKLATNVSGAFDDSDYSFVSINNPFSNKELTSTFDFSSFPYMNEQKAYFSVRYKVSFTTANFKSAYSSAKGSFKFSFKA